MDALGLTGFTQEDSSAESAFIPPSTSPGWRSPPSDFPGNSENTFVYSTLFLTIRVNLWPYVPSAYNHT